MNCLNESQVGIVNYSEITKWCKKESHKFKVNPLNHTVELKI